ncbi:unnamed protein product [Acanthoscelides obtectus]|uniref:MADF domain-containing protein n=1 Tax=Acanthoscelides obtectus TaxID=200917 RepID=A0A9P0PW93_ACAOB|nr:unnamed protein product [Acanthoscelides obtectus]CAK1650161.1 hypothetical protein AOBTE_LOCUS16651 [Acanthoscelides obtectus]
MWDNDIELKFIEFFQAEPILWDTKHRNYKNKNLNHDAWGRIAQLMDLPIPDLKKKKESLFASYRKYRKMVKDSHQSGAGENELYKPVWFAYEALDGFLSDGLTPKITINTQSRDEQPGKSTIISEEEIMNKPGETKNEITTPRTGRSRSLQCEVKEAGRHVKEALSLFQESVKRRESQEHPDDCEIYGMGLAKKLRAFSEEERLEIMYEFNGIILNRRRTKQPNRFTNRVFNPSSEYTRSSSAIFSPSPGISCYSEPLQHKMASIQNVRMTDSAPPEIHTSEVEHTLLVYSKPLQIQTPSEEKYTIQMYSESPQVNVLQNADAQSSSNIHIISVDLLRSTYRCDVICNAFNNA